MTKKQKKMTVRLAVSVIFMVFGMILEGKNPYAWIPFIISYLAAGYDIPLRAVRNIKTGQFFDENLLMTIATFGAVAVGALEEAVAVMLFYQIGELFSDYAVNKSRKSITQLMDINPEYANLLRNGTEEQVDPYEVQVGDRILVKPGEKVPLDGVVVKGASSLNTSALTGESMPAEVHTGDNIISGSINMNGVLEVEVKKLFDDSTVAKILELVENASSRKAKAETFITRFARVYTPIVVALAALFAVIPPLVFGQPWSVWVYRACSFLVVSCPCALVISIPLSFFGGLGAASKNGILMKGSNYLEAVGALGTIAFDKTGTLTTGKFTVTEILDENNQPGSAANQESCDNILELAAYGEAHSNHPIAQSVRQAYAKTPDAKKIISTEELSGYGIHAVLQMESNTINLYIGNRKLMDQQQVKLPESVGLNGTTLYLSDGSRYLGAVVISDTIRPDVPDAIRGLKAAGVEKLVMLTGDRKEVGERVASQLGIDQVYGNLLPGDKVQKVEELLKQQKEGRTLAFVGDGINDAPVLARADVGIAMGGIGSDAAVEAADVVIMDDEPSKIVDAIRIARKTMKIVHQNIIFAITVKILVLILAALGFASMWAAVFGDVGVSVLAILNAIRALNYKKK